MPEINEIFNMLSLIVLWFILCGFYVATGGFVLIFSVIILAKISKWWTRNGRNEEEFLEAFGEFLLMVSENKKFQILYYAFIYSILFLFVASTLAIVYRKLFG